MSTSSLDLFHPVVATWFRRALGEPTRAQALGWPPIHRGESSLLLAPTGSGKTLAAFLVAINRLIRDPPSSKCTRTRVLYVSPLKALAIDVERNLRVPIEGIEKEAQAAGLRLHVPTLDVRTGDTPARDRARMARAPADVLITTPESLYLILTSRARDTLASIDTLIVDEVHALVPTKRGAHLALSIERIEAMRARQAPPLQRIGLSATQRPLEEVARWLVGFEHGSPRPVTIVDAGSRREMKVVVEAIAPIYAETGDSPSATVGAEPGYEVPSPPRSRSVWPGLHARVVELVRAHRSTIVFVNSRRLAERLATAINDLAGEEIALAHHGSLAHDKRQATEERLKRGDLRAIVATSSLELGIDMGAVDLVVQIESPPSIASGLQRVGRACHGVRGVPNGVLLPKHRQDLVACAAAAASMRAGDVEETFYPRNSLDVLSQQIVAMASMEALSDGTSAALPEGGPPDSTAADAVSSRPEIDLLRLVRRAAPFADLPQSAYESVLDMLSGLYPSDDFAELRPRITWNRGRGRIEGRAGSHRLAVTSGGTIPDRGLYGVFTAPTGAPESDVLTGGRRVGELDEEMVFELRGGEVFLLGASSWRTERITHDRVIVSPAAGEPGKMPFWHGDRPGRTRAFGARIGKLVRRIAEGRSDTTELCDTHAMALPAATALQAYVREQIEATGEVPSDKAIVVERFLDEVGDWRVVVLCPFGTRVIAPWAIAVAAALREKYVEVDLHYTDDGMAFRIPACETPPPAEIFLPPADAIERMVTRALDGTPLFASRFRECAGRALLLPRRDPRRRTPLWAQRKRAADLLAVASRHPSFPIVLETYRECLRDVFDLPGLVTLLGDVESRRIGVTTVDRRNPSPFAASVLFAFVANFIYEDDAPLAERRAQALSIDFERLRELLGEAELRTLLDEDVLREHEAWLQRISRPATNVDAVHDMLLSIGDLSLPELNLRCSAGKATTWARALVQTGRAVLLRIGREERLAAVEDAARLRDALGVELPRDLPPALLASSPNPLRELIARFARTHGPFVVGDVANRLGTYASAVESETARLVQEERIAEGAFLPRGAGRELCGRDVLDAIRRKSLAKLRRTIEPVPPAAQARLIAEWQGVTRKRRGRGALKAVIAGLQGCPLVASTLESHIFPARIDVYRPSDLDALCASGEVVWAGLGPLGADDGRVAFYLAEDEALLARPAAPVPGATAAAIRDVLTRRGAVFFADIAREVGTFPNDLLDALWQMVWAGEATNDTLEPLRGRSRSAKSRPRPRKTGDVRSVSRSRAGGGANGFVERRPTIIASRATPSGGEGRWSLRAARWIISRSDTDRRMAIARALLDRYGVVTREAAHAEGVAGGFAAIYDVLKALESRGRVRRGYFVEGRGGAQFALPGADERLRALREPDVNSVPLVLAATDPANAWGALLDWPETHTGARPQRAAGAMVVLLEGALLGWIGRGARPLLTFLPEGEPDRTEATGALARGLAELVDGGSRTALLVSSIDGVDAARSPLAPVFVRAGFGMTARGLLKRRALDARGIANHLATKASP